MADKKMTKKEMFAQVIALAQGEEISIEVEEIVAFAQKEIELLDRKKSSKSKKEKEKDALDEKIKDAILEALEETDKDGAEPMSASEILKAISEEFEDLSIQKVSAILKKMCEEEDAIVEKFVEKRKSFFRLV